MNPSYTTTGNSLVYFLRLVHHELVIPMSSRRLEIFVRLLELRLLVVTDLRVLLCDCHVNSLIR